jgi:hypothetical protein
MFCCSDSEVNALASISATDHLRPKIFRCQLPFPGAKSGYFSVYEKASRLSPYAHLGSERIVASELLRKLGLAGGPRGHTAEFGAERHG